MAVLKEKYKSLAPRSSFLSDVVVLAQAWKKAHNYVRRHNWYQNTLELDCSAVQLKSLLSRWATSLKDGTYRPAALRMVLAPKNAMWEFGPGWCPKERDLSKQILRPLAHLEIGDQTISTAAMLCLADCIETAQGNPAISEPENARDAAVYSYGNRLYCSWEGSAAGSRAHFSWGNTNVYSRYYQDYQKFVSRPVAIARNYQQSTSGSSIYVVKLDISAFYDNIEIPALIKSLRREYASFRGKHPGTLAPDKRFWTMLASVFAFEWNAGDAAHGTLLRDGVLPGGLPQGMVSSGFFANAYLLEFDRAIGRAVHKRSRIGSDREISILDYCRYVDDLRIVVAVTEGTLLEQEIATAVTNWIQRRLDQCVGGKSKLRVNAEKTEVERYSDLGGRSGVAARMKSLQKELSGPFDFNSLSQIEAGLHGLLAQAELGLQAKPLESVDNDMPPLGLIAAPKLEVRDDTLTRFSAYRLTRTLRLRRGMTDLSEETNEGLAKDALLHEFEVAARRLVAAWSVNPSLVQVLLYALDLFPSPELLSPVLQALLSKLSPSVSGYERNVALYVLSEVLRAGATETGRASENDIGFSVGSLDDYRAELCKVADRLLQSDGIPWYVKQQAMLLLSACQQQSVASDEAELALHVILADFVDGSYRTRTIGHSEAISIALVGHQILRDPRHFSKWFRSYAKQATRSEVAAAFETIGQTNSGLLATITKIGRGAEAVQRGLMPAYLGHYLDSRWKGDSPLPTGEWIQLGKVITHPSNPLSQENALLQLLSGLIELASAKVCDVEKFTPLTIELRSSDWSLLTDPRHKSLDIQYRPRRFGVDPRYATPLWCEPKLAWLYSIGRILRAAATGDLDFTAGHWVLREEVGWYRGIRSTWHKRRSGMSQAPTALGGTWAGITPWLSELLLRMLGWPGIVIDTAMFPEMAMVRTPGDLAVIVNNRLKHQGEIYAKSSALPVYIYPVDWELRENRKLRVVLLQGLMPSTSDMKAGLDSLNAPGFRERHRNHLAAVLQLAHRKIAARDSALGEKHRPRVDLVIAPEYSVHVDDQDLMRQFSDSVGGMLFYGLLGARHPVNGAPVNAARWLVPQRRAGKRSWVEVDQGKGNLTSGEIALGVTPWRPYQVIVELSLGKQAGFRVGGAICYDATDIRLAADLRDLSHMFVVTAMNQDVKTFDSLVSALRYHMYQHVLIANTGEFGGSTAQAPYDVEHARLIAHSHGAGQLSVNIFDIDVDHFGPPMTACMEQPAPAKPHKGRPLGKTPPAGLNRKR